MGNKISQPGNNKKKFPHKLSKLLKLKFKRLRARSPDKFIVDHCSANNSMSSIDCSLHSELDLRRVVFVSLIGLRTTWRNAPPHVLYAAFCILPLKRRWIYFPSQYEDELAQLSPLHSDETKEFIHFLKWKDSQNLVYWMLDELESKNEESASLVDSFWFNLNQKLISLYDPVTGDRYKPLQLNIPWWQNRDKFLSKYDTKAASILIELYFVTMKFSNIQEILYQSNPDSLIPIQFYANVDSPRMEIPTATSITLSHSSVESSDDNGTWFISEHYDPYDIEEDQSN